MNYYRDKYEKYKNKYLELKEQIGGDPNYAYIALIYPPYWILKSELTDVSIYLKSKKKYNLPGGKIKKGEAPLDAALRIFKELTGYNNIDNMRDKFTELIIKKTIIFYYVLKLPEDEDIKKEINTGKWFAKSSLNSKTMSGSDTIENKTIIKTVIKKAGF
jgi:hypothetical protein